MDNGLDVFRPLERGWIKAFNLIMIPSAITTLVAIWAWTYFDKGRLLGTILCPLFALAIFVILGLGIMMASKALEPSIWNPLYYLFDYWYRNVVGFAVWYSGPAKDSKIRVSDRRDTDDHLFPQHTTIIVPLGGWFHRPELIPGEDLQDWQKRIIYSWRIGKYGTHPNGDRFVTLIDERGGSLRIDPATALNILEVQFLFERYWLDGMLIHTMVEIPRLNRERDQIAKSVDEVERELESVQSALEASRRWRLKGITIVDQTIEKIAGTRRFKNAKGPTRSVEAQHIREWLMNEMKELVDYLPPDHALRLKYRSNREDSPSPAA